MSQEWFSLGGSNTTSTSLVDSNNVPLASVPRTGSSSVGESITTLNSYVGTVNSLYPIPLRIAGKPTYICPLSTTATTAIVDLKHTPYAETPLFSTDASSTLDGGDNDFYLEDIVYRTNGAPANSSLADVSTSSYCYRLNSTVDRVAFILMNKTNTKRVIARYYTSGSYDFVPTNVDATAITNSVCLRRWSSLFATMLCNRYGSGTYSENLVGSNTITISWKDIVDSVLLSLDTNECIWTCYPSISGVESFLSFRTNDYFYRAEAFYALNQKIIPDNFSLSGYATMENSDRLAGYPMGNGFAIKSDGTYTICTHSSSYGLHGFHLKLYGYEKMGGVFYYDTGTALASSKYVAVQANPSCYKRWLVCFGYNAYMFLASLTNYGYDYNVIYDDNTDASISEFFSKTYANSSYKIITDDTSTVNSKISTSTTPVLGVTSSDYVVTGATKYIYSPCVARGQRISNNTRCPLYLLNYPDMPAFVIEFNDSGTIVAIVLAYARSYSATQLSASVATSNSSGELYGLLKITANNYAQLCGIYGDRFRSFLKGICLV